MAEYEYFVDINGKITKKKKEEKKSTATSQQSDYFVDISGNVTRKAQELDRELAPTKPAKKEEKVDFFKKGGLFEDGWDFGDGWRTMGLTIADASLSALEGLGGMAEGILDLGGHIVAGGADLLGADNFADDLRKVVNHNTVSEAAEWIRDIGGEGGIGEGSVLGRTTRAVGQGVGQIGGILLTGGLGSAAGLGAAGTTLLTSGTMFASSTGAGVSEAYNDGASDAEAWAYGTIKGGVDAASELIFGGLGKGVKALGVSHGLSSADDILAKKLSSKISSKVAKTFVQAGVKASGEGFEEVLAGLGTAAAKMIYKDGVSYQELLEDENLLEQFVVGALSSGLSQSGGVVNSVKTGTDFISGMTANEETVVNKEVEKRIAQEETNGNKLSNKEKNAIYETVVNDMDKGYISTDTIEEALGGDTFKAYQDAIKSEEAIKQEYEKLANTPKGELTHIQEKRLAELEAQIEAEPKSKALKQQLSESAFNLAKDSRLAETYNEQGRRTQAFQADLTKYDAKQAEVVKKAVESGILNNTNRTHEFVDLVAKISADKGVSFDFANNAKIKESGFTVDGATVNGFVTDSGITVNIQSAKALNTVVGHEITHILEGTELYDGLQKAVVEYAKTKGEYDSRLAAITKLYEGKNADVNKELVADLVGDYLFTDSDFIARLSTENRNVFQKIYDEIKYLAKVATAGSKEARQLEKAKRAFEKVYKESKAEKNTTKNGDVKYDIVALDDGKVYVEASRNVINGTTLDAQRKDITEFFNILLDGNNSLDIHTIEGDILTITKAETADKARDNYKTVNEQRIKLSDEEFAVKLRVEAHIDEVAEVSRKIGQDGDKKNHTFAKDGFTYRRAYFKDFDGQYYEITLSIGHNGTVATVYNVGKIKGSVSPSAKIIAAVRSKPLGETTSNKKVPQKEENVKFSLSADTEGNKLTKAQQEYFKDSKVVDENGNLKVMYHGTQNGGFHEFSNDYTDDGISFFFTDRNDVAASYSSSYETYAAKAFKTAQDANNFFAEIGKSEYEVIEKDGEYTLYDDGDEVATSDSLAEIYDEFRDWEGVGYGDVNYKVYLNLTNPLVVDAKGGEWNAIQIPKEHLKGINESWDNPDPYGYIHEATTRQFADYARESGFDGVIFNNLVDSGGFSNGGEGASTVAIAFESNQIKSTANTKPTVDTDIRYSISADTDKTYLDAVKRGDTEAAQRMVAEAAEKAGYTIKAYHGTNALFNVFEPNLLGSKNFMASSAYKGFFAAKSRETAENYTGLNSADTMAAMLNPDAKAEMERIKAKHHLAEANAEYERAREAFFKEYRNAHGYKEAVTDIIEGLKELYPNVPEKKIKDITMSFEYSWNSQDSGNGTNNVNRMNDEFKDTEAAKEFEKINKQIFEEWEQTEIKRRGFIPNVKELYLKLQNPLIHDFKKEGRDVDFSELIDDAKKNGNDGCIFKNVQDGADFDDIYVVFENTQLKSADPVTYDENRNVIPLSERFNDSNEDIRNSLSNGEQKQYGNYNVYGKDIALQEDIAPVREDIQPKAQTAEEMFPDDNEPLSEVDAAAMNYEALWSMTDEDAPPVMEEPYTEDIEPSYISDPLKDKTWEEVGKRNVKAYSFEHPEVRPFFKQAAEGMLTDLLSNTLKGQKIYSWNDGLLTVTGQERWTSDAIAKLRDNAKMSYKDIERGLRAIIAGNGAENNAASKRIELVISEELFNGYIDHTSGYKIPADEDYINLLAEMQNAEANPDWVDSLMDVADELAPPIEEDIAPIKETVTEPVTELVAEEVPENKAIRTVQQRLEAKLENAEKALEELRKKKREYNESIESEIEAISQALNKKKDLNTKVAQDLMKRIIRKEEMRDNINADYEKRIADQQVKVAKLKEEVKSGESPTEQAAMREELHENMIDNIKGAFAEKGFDFDKVLENAKDLSTFSTVDNTPQRVLEKSLGYKEGKVLADLTVNKVAENETKAIRWLNSITDRKNGLLAQLVKEYNIKPGSKESAAAQMYAEGFFVNDDNEIIEYKDRELAIDFPDAKVRKNIKGLARDPRIREFYDGALAAINESRARNAYPEIKPLKNYFLHFRAMDDTFSRLGIPFNPNDIKAKDLPTDLNGVTADLKPGQPYFASSMHRKGKRTSFDLLGGIEQYATGASRQIFHIDDIQTLRALRNYVADTFGQAKGLEDLDLMTEEEAEAKIKEVYGAHLSTFAKFLNEEANVIAGKTALTDRGLEGIIGRRGITFLDSLNKQVGANMIGFNISSSLTNLIAPVQAFAKTNKAAFVKAMAQTASNRLKAIKGQSDGFMEKSPIAIRRKGADRFARTPWQKVSDAGYVFMSAVDSISTELVARAKYNELTKKGMDSEQAHIETDKWVSRLMGDRSLGQQPQLYNSKMLGMFTKFQLEVRNQLDAQFYDTIQEAKLSNEEVKNELERNAKTAAKVTKTFVELAVLQHLFGKAFESVAGYNPAFDIISALVKAFGFDDDEDDDDTFTDNLWEGAQELLGDLPYTSTLTGGRIPISSALPVEQFITGKDSYGNEKSRWETLGEAAPYYLMPGGYGQIKKTTQGLSMFDDDLPIAGSYTDSGNLRFPVAPTLPNIAQAAVFGQYASKNARDYFDNEYAPLKEKQIQEFIDLDIPIKDYRDIREGLKGKDTLGEKVAYIATLDLPIDKKNILVNNAANREEPIDMSDYGEYTDWGEFDYAKKYPDKYAFLKANNITVKQYNKFTDDEKEAWSWAYQNPEKFALSKSIASDVVKYRSYTKALSDITADKDENGKSISGSRKEKVISYINNLDADYGEKIILFKSEYPSDDTYNYEIVEYLGSREDITYDEMITILYELGFTVKDGRAYWD